MTIERKVVGNVADTKHGMTLDELGAFVAEAMRAEVPGDTVVKITATWRQSIKKIGVTGR